MVNQPIIYTPQFQPPTWQDNVDLVAAEGPNGLNAQFQNLRAELDALSNIVKQLSDLVNGVSQTATNANNNANTANTTATNASSATAATNAATKAVQAIVCGYVQSDGTILSGSKNFTVTKSGPGLYDIFFNTAFSSTPAVQASQVYSGDITYGGGDITDNSVVVGMTTKQCRILTGNAGGHTDRNFSFMAYCPPA